MMYFYRKWHFCLTSCTASLEGEFKSLCEPEPHAEVLEYFQNCVVASEVM